VKKISRGLDVLREGVRRLVEMREEDLQGFEALGFFLRVESAEFAVEYEFAPRPFDKHGPAVGSDQERDGDGSAVRRQIRGTLAIQHGVFRGPAPVELVGALA
jgi:hypothetical protein